MLDEFEDILHCSVILTGIISKGKAVEAGKFQLRVLVQFVRRDLAAESFKTIAELAAVVACITAFWTGIVNIQIVFGVSVLGEYLP